MMLGYAGVSSLELIINSRKQNCGETPARLTDWRWREGSVDATEEHIELRYGDASKTNHESWLPIALVGRPADRVFPVFWLMKPDDPSHEEMISAAKRELDFYLVELLEPDPWAYAKYHCNTAANIYSSVHWSYIPNGNCEQRHSSMTLRTRDPH